MLQFDKPQQAICTNANPRREFHGKDMVRAIDLQFEVSGDNTLLDLIQQGLREHHFHSKALDARQETVEGIEVPLPDLRFPKLPSEYRYDAGNSTGSRGYRWVWDWGTQDAHVDFTDAVLKGIHYEIQQGGSVKVKFTVTYNGDELADNDLYGELCALPTMGEVYIQLFAPPELLAVKKGYRAGKPDASTKPKDPAQAELGGQESGHIGDPGAFVETDEDDGMEPGSAEAAFAATEKPQVH
jgi:hypothetical protein